MPVELQQRNTSSNDNWRRFCESEAAAHCDLFVLSRQLQVHLLSNLFDCLPSSLLTSFVPYLLTYRFV